MKSIPIYSSEKSIASQIQSNRSIAYTSKVEPSEYREQLLELPNIVRAGETDKDLYFHQSILVTTNVNANDDCFTPSEVWKARQTPLHKPTNLEHNELDIVGHMTASFAIDEQSKLIDNNTPIDKLPGKFHILTSAVIYRLWEDESRAKATEQLIEKIESGDLYVSMEAIFNDFDYLLDNGQEQKIIARNHQTSFLTQMLRIYGGAGEYKDYKVYRVLKDLTFSGKGYVENPANKESIIFTKNDIFDFSNAKLVDNEFKNELGVLSTERKNESKPAVKNHMEKTMAEDIYQKQAEKLEAENKSLAKEIEELKSQLSKADVEKLKANIDELNSSLEDAKSEIKSKSDELTKANDKVKEAESGYAEVLEEKSKLEEKIEKIEAERKIESRISDLVDVGLDKEKAAKIVDKYENVDDEVFADVVETQKELVKARTDKEEDKKKKKKEMAKKVTRVEADEDEETAESAEIDESEVEDEADLSVANETNDDEIISSLSKVLASRMKFSKNKTESK